MYNRTTSHARDTHTYVHLYMPCMYSILCRVGPQLGECPPSSMRQCGLREAILLAITSLSGVVVYEICNDATYQVVPSLTRSLGVRGLATITPAFQARHRARKDRARPVNDDSAVPDSLCPTDDEVSKSSCCATSRSKHDSLQQASLHRFLDTRSKCSVLLHQVGE